MYAHHQQTIARLADRCQADPTMLALIIVGSVARGDAHAGSDVDCYLVATDAEYQSRLAAGTTGFHADDLAGLFGRARRRPHRRPGLPARRGGARP